MTRLHCADVMEMLPTFAEASFDACFCDPPYGLGFMGKDWDRPGRTFFERKPVRTNDWDHVGGNHNPVDSADRARTQRKENASYQAWTEAWAREVYRVLKPGAPLLAFGGPRTHHRLMCAIEDTGFEIKDCLMWLYGSGFPKSLDISKAIDKAAGAEREILGPNPNAGRRVVLSYKYDGRANPKPLGDGSLTAPATDAAKRWAGYGTALKPAWEPVILAMKPCEGTFAESALRHGVAGLNIDGCRIETRDNLNGGAYAVEGRRGSLAGDARIGAAQGMFEPGKTSGSPFVQPTGRWPANLLLGCACDGDHEPDCPVRMLDEQSGERKTTCISPHHKNQRTGDFLGKLGHPGTQGFNDSGGASRFFYCAKASRAERGEGNNHPTVKPLKLCEYFARLILPPARETPRRLIVPFAGSASEMLGAIRAGWDDVVGIEIDEGYCKLARTRLDAEAPPLQRELDRCDREIQEMRQILLEGHPDVPGLTMALSDWNAEQGMILAEAR